MRDVAKVIHEIFTHKTYFVITEKSLNLFLCKFYFISCFRNILDQKVSLFRGIYSG